MKILYCGDSMYNCTMNSTFRGVCPFDPYNYYAQRIDPLPQRITKAAFDLSSTFRTLWEQHSVWTRLTIMSIVLGLPDEQLVTNRLLKNPEDLGNVLRRFYGDAAASRYIDLVKSHLIIAARLVKAAKAGDSKAAEEIEKEWYANADAISALLARINPYWSEEDWKSMYYNHLRLVKEEAVSLLNKKYSEGISVYDEIEKQALRMADTLTEGIIRQFPQRFL